MSLQVIATLAGVPNDNRTTVRRALLRAGIHVRSISEAKTGKTAWNKGRPMSEEQKQLLSRVKQGRPSPLSMEQRAALSQKMQDIKGTNDLARVRAGRPEARRIFTEVEPCGVCGEIKSNMHRHHRDENTHNNTPDNVVWLCAPCHRRGHTILPEGIWNRAGLVACVSCGRSDRPHAGKGFCYACYKSRYLS